MTGPITYNGSSAYGLIAGGDTVTINGDDFTGATAVNFGNTPATSFTVSSDGTYITATDPSGMTTGTVDTTVTTPLGTTDIHPNDQFTYVQAPVITSVSPATGSTNGGTQVTITGSGLALATAVQFGYNYTSPNLGTITSDTDGQIVATSPATFEGMAGTVDVTVTTPFGTSTTSPANQFTYVAPPSITSLDTTSGSVYGGTLVTISGRGLAAATEVDFGSNPATIISNTDGQIIVLSPEATGDSPGPVDVTVTNAYGTGELYPSQFTYGLPPAVTSISPASGPAAGGTSVVISGDNLTNVIAVDFGGVASPTFSANADGTITAVSPPDAPSTVDITVVTYGGPSPTTLADQFTYFPPPIVASVSPTAGPTGGGTTLTISGIGLGGATSVDFTDSQGDDYQGTIQNESGNSLVVTSPNYGVATTVDITVTTASGTSATSSADQFNYVVVPTVSSISPTAGLRAGGDTVEIYGANLAGATSVAFGSAPARFTINVNYGYPYYGNPAGDWITAISPPGSDGTVDVTVATDGASSPTSAANQFTYLQPVPAVTGVSPADGAAAGGETVTISGTDLDNASEVDFNGVAGTIVPGSDTATQIMATVPAGTLGTVDVTVTTIGGTSPTTPADQFTGVAAPVVSSTAGAIGSNVGQHQRHHLRIGLSGRHGGRLRLGDRFDRR